MKFEPTYQERSYRFVVPSFAQYSNEQVAKIYYHLRVNKAFPQALNSFDLAATDYKSCFFYISMLNKSPKNKNSNSLTA